MFYSVENFFIQELNNSFDFDIFCDFYNRLIRGIIYGSNNLFVVIRNC